MPTVIYHHDDGTSDRLDVPAGTTVMRAAVDANVTGIVGECGGNMECATCHVYVREAYLDELPEISEDQELMLEETAAPRDPTRSRLGCQLKLGPGLELLEVDVPDRQY